MNRRASLSAAFASVTVVSICVSADAQTNTSSTQREYNDRGVQHMFDGQYSDAAVNFQSSLALGETNIAWLNYGRAMFKMGRCEEARGAFAEVPNSPAVDAPSPSEIAIVLDRFSEEWGSTCTGRLKIECPDEPAEVRIDDGAPFACHTNEIAVVPGPHEVEHVGWGERFSVEVGESPVLVSLTRSIPTESPKIDVQDESVRGTPMYAEDGGFGTRRVVGLAVMSTGIAALGTSLALELAWVNPAFDNYRAAKTPEEWESTRAKARSAQTANRVLLFSGIGVTALGATLFALPQSRSGVALKVGPGSIAAEVKW